MVTLIRALGGACNSPGVRHNYSEGDRNGASGRQARERAFLLLSAVGIRTYVACPSPNSTGTGAGNTGGDGAINSIRQRTAREPIDQVQDRNRRPVAGAVVMFQLPADGPGGAFPNGA